MIDFFWKFRRVGRPASSGILIPFIIGSDVIVVAGSHFNRHQHSHATSCRHFHVGPQAQIPVDFPMPHPGQSQTGMSHHLGPAHQPAAALHPPLNHIPAPPRHAPDRTLPHPQTLRPPYEYPPSIHIPPPPPVPQQPRYLAEGTDWDLSVDPGLPQYHVSPLTQHYQHYLTSPRLHHFPRNTTSAQVVSLRICVYACVHFYPK
ncbi:E3 ubiquitin-protein ligase RNF165 [Labeo rohita]|uniref:E3 ubiquitin-protein ligase RNF165 n=1 Tax=Labeo rohita TaxID=84645 RepID=A0ABQ8MGC9_LABRO|nr:E3 ubiquitin-protein ligase RNF165 [Labeo rohita]